MGVVYKAEQVGLKRSVAIKVILAGRFAGGDALDRFLAEGQTLAQLQHPGIVQIYDIGK
jgi:serine/threonine protein kinase